MGVSQKAKKDDGITVTVRIPRTLIARESAIEERTGLKINRSSLILRIYQNEIERIEKEILSKI